MSILFVYIIAFDDKGRFLMIKHRKRAWEMPGGRLEPGESPSEAAKREFLEETGMDVKLGEETLEVEGGLVFYGRVGKRTGDPAPGEVLELGFFTELPKDLSFPKVEYERMLKRFSGLLGYL